MQMSGNARARQRTFLVLLEFDLDKGRSEILSDVVRPWPHSKI